MFFHNLKYSFQSLLKNKALIFWTFAFPIILGTLFKMAFQDIEKNEKLSIINIGIVTNETWENNEIWKKTMEHLSNPNHENQLFEITYARKESLLDALQNDTISGFINIEESPEIVVKESGINETILKQVVDEIMQTTYIYETSIQSGMQNLILENQSEWNEWIANLTKKIEEIQAKEIEFEDNSSKNMSYTMIEYYTLIAMSCLYGGILAMVAINKNLANMSAVGKRISISPTKKSTLMISSTLASWTTQMIGLSLLFFYTIFVLKVDYGAKMFLVILLSVVGSLAGLSIGIATSCLCKGTENAKTGIILAITMAGCFLSGMMGITMKYVVDTHVPILNKINPANMITDGFYSLYYYDTTTRFTINFISLLLFSGMLLMLSSLVLRRQKYDSI